MSKRFRQCSTSSKKLNTIGDEMIHITTETKDQTFLIGDHWHLIFENRVPNAWWDAREQAETALALLQGRYTVIDHDFSIQPRRRLK
jgi:hypothetical protein